MSDAHDPIRYAVLKMVRDNVYEKAMQVPINYPYNSTNSNYLDGKYDGRLDAYIECMRIITRLMEELQ